MLFDLRPKEYRKELFDKGFQIESFAKATFLGEKTGTSPR